MANRFTLPLLTAAMVAAAAAVPVTTEAQSFSIVVHDSTLVLREGQLVDLKATITNEDLGPINVRAVRYMNELPGAGWYTAMCFGEMCYPPDMDLAPPARVAPGGTVEFKLTVGTESATYGTGVVRAGITFDTGEGTESISQEFVVNIDGTSSAPIDATTTSLRTARPNPARTSTVVPLEAGDHGDADRVQLVDALGRTVVDLRDVATTADGVRVDVSAVPDGAYFYRVDIGGATRTGRLVVAH